MTRHAKAWSAQSTARSLMLSFCLMVVAALALGASPALGAEVHPYTGVSFGPDGAGGSKSFEGVGSVAVDPANGDVYVYDPPAGKIYKFDSAGAPVNFSATGTNAVSGVGGGFGGAEYEIALAPAGSPGGTAGDIYVANNGQAVHVYSSAGAELGEIGMGGETCGVATDSAGDFYAGIYESTVKKFTPTANPPTAANLSGVGTVPHSICNVAADGLGNVYATSYNGSPGLFKLEGIAASPTQVDSGARTMGVAPGSNDIYANRGDVVVQYDSAGNELGAFGEGELSGSRGVAINSGATKVYVGAGQKVKVFGAVTTLPDATTEAATAIIRGGATLHGTIGAAGGPDTTCAFQYTPQGQFFSQGFTGASEAPCAPAGPFTGNSSTAVSAAVTGLSPETTYIFRLLGSSENGDLGGKPLNFTTPGAVNVTTGTATALAKTSATLNGTVNPEGNELEECFFEYGTNFALGSKVPCAESTAAIGNGNSPVAVHANVTGLDGATEYLFRFGGKNEFGTNVGQFAEFKTRGPGIERASVAGVLPTSAIFKAQINPNGEATIYSFEYVSEAEFKASGFANAIQLPSGGEAIGSGTTGVEVEQEATGLTPRTTYHLRVTASNASGDASGPEIVFSTFPTDGSGGLPDGRAYEQTSPVKKDGGNIQGMSRGIKTSPSGDGITFVVLGGLPEAEGGQDWGSFLARRSATGWTTQGLLPSAKLTTDGQVLGLSEDLSVNYTFSNSYSPPKRAFGEKDTHSNQYTQIWSADSAGAWPEYKGSSANNDFAIFEVFDALTDGAAEGGVPNTYVWDRVHQRLVLAGVFNDEQAPVNGDRAGSGFFERDYGTYLTQEQHVLSADGSKFFFTDNGTHQLYMRVNPTEPQSEMSGEECLEPDKACTYQISKSQRSTPDPMGPQAAKFRIASADGSNVLFMSQEELTDDANTGPEDNSSDLYSYDTNTHELTDLTSSTLAQNPNGGEVSGVLGISEDASYIYFGAGGVFAPGATAGEHCRDGEAQAGTCNIYRWHEGDVTLLTQLKQSNSERAAWLSDLWAPFEYFQHPRSSRVSPDGKTLTILTPRNLTGYDSHGYLELYRFHVGDDEPLCVSCMPSGEEPRGNTTLQSIESGFPSTQQNAFTSRNMAASGNRIFFESVDKLVGADTNGVKDVYEWEANGTGSCTSSDQDGGCLYLISTGTSPEPSYFADASESGDDAYFFTNQPLVGQDLDELVDVYDARVGGGLASQNPPPPSICTGEACRPGATPAPAGQTAGSSTFSGPGNPPAKKANHKKKHKSKSKKKQKSKKHHKKSAKSRQGGNR